MSAHPQGEERPGDDAKLLPALDAVHRFAQAHGAVHAKAHRNVTGPAMRKDEARLDAERKAMIAELRALLRSSGPGLPEEPSEEAVTAAMQCKTFDGQRRSLVRNMLRTAYAIDRRAP